MNDSIDLAGQQARHSGKGESDCPYVDTYDRGDYWESDAGKRQKWMRGFRTAWCNNEIMRRYGRWPSSPVTYNVRES